MTENKIREFVKSLRDRVETFIKSGWAIDGLINDYTKSADTIENLFEEIQQYRAIGTVEEIQKVISFLSNDNDNSIIDDMNMLNTYKFIGTIDEFKALKEKNMSKKPIDKSKNPTDWHVMACPNCEHIFWNSGQFVHYEPKFCNYCGQKLDWSE